MRFYCSSSPNRSVYRKRQRYLPVESDFYSVRLERFERLIVRYYCQMTVAAMFLAY